MREAADVTFACAAQRSTSAYYWEERARQFAGEQDGLAAVCSYGMPSFYNRYIDWLQRRALAPWLPSLRNADVLDAGCGVGRWAVELAKQGARVTGTDISETMLAQASRRAREAGVAERCRFVHGDLTELYADESFDAVLSVTVLQHITDDAKFASTVASLGRTLRPGGRMILLEVAPSRYSGRCDSRIFTGRCLADWRAVLRASGFEIFALGGVDPAPFKIQLLPYYARMPRRLARAAMGVAVAASAPIDLLARTRVHSSWHKVIVAGRAQEPPK